MPRTLSVPAAVGAAVLLAALLWLGRLEAGGPVHTDLVLPGGVPGTLYLPSSGGDHGSRHPAPPRGELPPAVVVAHGIVSDRAGMSSLSRRLASNGYTVLAIDLRGHGTNRNPFTPSPREPGLVADVAAAVDWLRTSSYADGARIAVLGHSMGARAVLRFAESDSGIDATVLVSGGAGRFGPYRPANALVIFAEGDPADIRARASEVAAGLAGVAQPEPGRRYGDFQRGDAVRLVEIPGADHATILWSRPAAKEMLAWLDEAFGITRATAPTLGEPRLRALLLALVALPFALVGVGLVLGGIAPAWREEEGSWSALGLLAFALVAALPLSAATPLASFLDLEIADGMIGALALAGTAVLAGRALSSRPLLPGPTGPRTAAAAGVAFAAAYAFIAPLGVCVHRLAPTGERALAGLGAALLLLPFFLAFETLLRRGAPRAALARCIAGRLLVLTALPLGVLLGALDGVVLLLVGPFAAFFAIQEIVAAVAYPLCRNPLASALFQSLLLAWPLAAIMPLR